MALNFIAEIGSNWYHPDKEAAKSEALRAISQAAYCGATIVKFQVFRSRTLYSEIRAKSLMNRARQYEFPISWLSAMKAHANRCGVKLWASIFDPEIIDQCAMYLDGIKVASGDLTYGPLLKAMADASARYRIPLALSTGAATEEEIADALYIVERNAPYEIILFHCVSAYPAQDFAINLAGGTVFSNSVDEIGFSDHTKGNYAAALAVGMGYTHFEKHFHGWGAEDTPDRSVSIGQDDFKKYIDGINYANAIVGEKRKRVHPSEIGERTMARRWKDGLRPNTERIIG